MSEEKPLTEGVQISSDELNKIEQEVLNKDSKDQDQLKESLRAEIKAEMEKADHLKNLEAENKRLSDAVLQQKKNRDEELETLKKQLETSKENEGSSKRIITPNQIQTPNFESEDKPLEAYMKNFTKETLKEVNSNSFDAFLKHTQK